MKATGTECFSDLLSKLDELDKENNQEYKRRNDRAIVALMTLYKGHYPRRRKITPERVCDDLPEESEAIIQKHKAEYDEWIAKHREKIKNVKEQLQVLANKVELKPSEKVWTLYYTARSTHYGSVGFSCVQYAKSVSDAKVDKATKYGIPAHVVTISKPRKEQPYYASKGWVVPDVRFQVWVALDEVGCAILERKEDVSLREWVRLCWKRGVNPRVYAPMLPAGYEDKHDLDYFGNDLTSKGGQKHENVQM